MKQPWRNAALLAGIYALLGGAYIVVSGTLAASSAVDVEELRDIEVLKGLLFVAVTSLLLFVGAFFLFTRARRAAAEMERSRVAFLAAQRRATAGLFAATIAHDFKNVLTVLSAGLHELADPTPTVERDDVVSDMRSAITRGTELAQRLGVSGRVTKRGEAEDVDVSELVRGAAQLLRTQTHLNACEVEVVADGHISRRVYPALVHQVVVNLALNAMEAAGRGGHVEVHAHADGPTGVVVAVHDDGPGIPAELRERLFDAFYTTREDGIGLGLLSVRLCAEMHGGAVGIDASPLGGACFTVTLQEPSVAAAA